MPQFDIDSNMTVGITSGSIMHAVSRHLVPKEFHDLEFVQLNGAGNEFTTGDACASELFRRFGDAFSAPVMEFPVPALFDDPETEEAMWHERSVKRILDVQNRMDLALFGLGSPFVEAPSHVYTGGHLDEIDYSSMMAAHVVGDVATEFFRADGTYQDIALNARASGPDISQIKRTPRRVCIVAGRSKLRSLRGALAANLITELITDLITDEATAHSLTP